MRSRYFFPIIAFAFMASMVLYFLVNPSYTKSIEAKYYYETGEYEEAYLLANEAFAMDVYNRMASTIMAQTKTSLKYVKYIKEAKGYLAQINEIALHETISDADRARIRLMSEVVVDGFVKLAPSVITDKALVDEALMYHNKFEKLLEKVTH